MLLAQMKTAHFWLMLASVLLGVLIKADVFPAGTVHNLLVALASTGLLTGYQMGVMAPPPAAPVKPEAAK